VLRLMLLRHAKSARPAGVADLDRPLAQRGRDAAPRMGRYLAEEGLLPDLVVVSAARRTQETWELVEPHVDATEIRFDTRIYEAPASRLLAVVRESASSARSVLMIGHNPGFEDLAKLLVGHGDRYAFARLTQKYPTAGLAVIDFDRENWSEIAPRSGRLDRFVTPKSLGAEEND
jgi:phosphohistidine phosphatase